VSQPPPPKFPARLFSQIATALHPHRDALEGLRFTPDFTPDQRSLIFSLTPVPGQSPVDFFRSVTSAALTLERAGACLHAVTKALNACHKLNTRKLPPDLRPAASHLQTAIQLVVSQAFHGAATLHALTLLSIQRRRIARELHNGPAQTLAILRLQLEMEGSALAETKDLVDQNIADIRRLTSDLRLIPAIRQLTRRFQQNYPGRVRFRLDPLPPLDPVFSEVVCRILQECYDNISHHSQASTVNVSLRLTDRRLTLKVEDDGIGFNSVAGPGLRNCFGLAGIREMVNLLGGSLSVGSHPKAEAKNADGTECGTRIAINLPLITKQS